MTGHAGRGTPAQALVGLVGAVAVGLLVWAGAAWVVVQAVKGLA